MGSPTARQYRCARELGDEILVLDDGERVAHHLNAEAAAVWRLCDGRTDVASIARRSGIGAQRTAEVLAQLGERGLLAPEPALEGATRRAVLRRAAVVGAVAAGVPAITSILVPTAAEAFTSQPQTQGSSGNGSTGGGAPQSANSSNPPDSAVGGSSEGGGTGAGGGKAGGQSSGGGAGPVPSVKRSGGNSGPGVLGDANVGAVGGAGGSMPLPQGTLPFTGSDVVRTAAAGGALLVAGTAGHVALRKRAAATPPGDAPAAPAR